jgi:peptidoglycan hydrolase-like protein with peptidoglycan-binding domain
MPVTALAFAEEEGAIPSGRAQIEPVSLVLSTDAISRDVLTRGRIIERGSKGEAVREWQTFLNMHGFTDASGNQLTIDGDFGRKTREATKAYQEWASIGIDGRVGPETLRAMLYTIDPDAGPVSDGQVAYDDGRKSAAAIVAPAEVDIPLPPPRPERGAGIPNPRLRPRPEDLTEDEIDELTRVDENGNYIVAPPRAPAAMTDTRAEAVADRRRSEAWANLEWTQRRQAAQAAAAKATRQRLTDARMKDDPYRPVARDRRSQSDVMMIRSTEAVREFARAMGDTYRRVLDRQTAAVPAGMISDAERRALVEIAMRESPSPAETVVDTYSFRPATGFIGPDFGFMGRARKPSLYEEMQRRFGPGVTYTPPMS